MALLPLNTPSSDDHLAQHGYFSQGIPSQRSKSSMARCGKVVTPPGLVLRAISFISCALRSVWSSTRP